MRALVEGHERLLTGHRAAAVTSASHIVTRWLAGSGSSGATSHWTRARVAVITMIVAPKAVQNARSVAGRPVAADLV